ncbi:hypothetical protein BT67DRAFT_418741 [Trichocladium antarcticum]|uniref:Uncharacterized protein n=1 Tax=Trichocladium antarcticum TaxID=1450529 RepID=A0AAN6UMA7_9PEZI|nr:hypothetical protein BT67DRAFT_418741 [Trichocladium antarcticum]
MTRPAFHPHQTPLQQCRPFSLIPLLESSITCSTTVLQTLHATTLTPWYLTIPLFALTINLCARLPTTLFTRRVALRRAGLTPLGLAWAGRVQRDMASSAAAAAAQEQAAGGPLAMRKWMVKYAAANAREQRRRNRRWGVQRWKDWVPALMVFPVWLAGIEALRRMCGGPRGMLGNVVFGLKGGDATGVGGHLAEGVKGVEDAFGGGGGVAVGADGAALATEVQEALAGSVADPTMATEGCLWFQDLMVADPYHVLPFALSAALALNLLPKSKVAARHFFGLAAEPGTVVMQSKWRLRLQRGLLMVAIAVGPLTMDLPAALHLYWISSSALTQLSTAIVARLMPLPTTVTPAKKSEQTFVMPERDETKDTLYNKRQA